MIEASSLRHAGPGLPMRLPVPEIIENGLTGGIVDSVEEAIACAAAGHRARPEKVRQRFEERFSATRMAKDYVRVYHKLLASTKADERLNRIASVHCRTASIRT
jgi:hypothetical protein